MAELDREIANIRNGARSLSDFPSSANSGQFDYLVNPPGEDKFADARRAPDPGSNSVMSNISKAPARVAQAVTNLLTPSRASVPEQPSFAQAATPTQSQQVAYQAPPQLRSDIQGLLSGEQSGHIGDASGFSNRAVAAVDPRVPTAPTYGALPATPRLNFDVGSGFNQGGGVFGALARGVNTAGAFADQNIRNKQISKGFADSVTAYDSSTKRMDVTSRGDIARAKNTIDLIKAGKEVQEAQLIGTHRALLAEYAKNPTPQLADMIALVKGHVLPDKIINFPESVINQSPPSAVSARHGTYITPNKGGGGFTVGAVGQSSPSPTDKVYIDKSGQRVRMVGDKPVAF